MISAKKSALFTMIYKAFLSGIGFINSALLARTLNMTDRAEFQYATTLSQGGMTFVGGFTNYYGYALPKYPEETRQVVQLGNLAVFMASLVVWVLTLLAMWLHLPFLHISRPVMWALFVTPLTFIFGFGSRILQASNEISWLNRANAAQPVLFTLILLPLYLGKQHLPDSVRITTTYLSWTASFIVAVVGTMYIAYKLLHLQGLMQFRFSKRHWLGTLHYGGWSSIAQSVNWLNYRIDFILVYKLLPVTDASIYGIAVVASEVLLNISGSIASVVFRRMTGNDRQDAIHITELSTRHTIISSTIVALGMYTVFPWLITTAYTKAYSASIVPFFILLPGLIIKAASNMIIQYATNSLGQPKTSIWMNGVSVVFNAVCCLIFLPTLGMVGGAIASTISYVLSYIVYVIWFSRVNHVSPAGLLYIRKADLVPYVEVLTRIVRRIRRR
jgi:O-antigen/teichoic acid export membrane protein